jgi:hypothetical protein
VMFLKIIKSENGNFIFYIIINFQLSENINWNMKIALFLSLELTDLTKNLDQCFFSATGWSPNGR